MSFNTLLPPCSPVCSRPGAVPEVLPGVGWWLLHHHLPHVCGSLLPDAHPGSHYSWFMARQVQVRFHFTCQMWTFDLKGSKMKNVQSWGRSLSLSFLLGFLPLVYLISRCVLLFNSSLPALPVQDYHLPVHRLHAGTGGPVSECHPWHHRHKQGRRPRQHDLPRVSRTRSDRTADVRMQMFTDTLWLPPLDLCPCWVWPWLPWEQGASNPAWQPLEETSLRTTRYEVTPCLDLIRPVSFNHDLVRSTTYRRGTEPMRH